MTEYRPIEMSAEDKIVREALAKVLAQAHDDLMAELTMGSHYIKSDDEDVIDSTARLVLPMLTEGNVRREDAVG